MWEGTGRGVASLMDQRARHVQQVRVLVVGVLMVSALGDCGQVRGPGGQPDGQSLRKAD